METRLYVSEISEDLICRSLASFNERNIGRFRSMVPELQEAAGQAGPTTRNAARLIVPLTIATDLNFLPPEVLQCYILRFPLETQQELSGASVLNLRFGYGVTQFLGGNSAAAIVEFDHILKATYFEEPNVRIQSMYYKARCLGVLGRDEEALTVIKGARELAEKHGLFARAAAIKVQESVFARQLGKSTDADCLLKEARTAVKNTFDYVAQANILGYTGEAARKRGRYVSAHDELQNAVSLWREQGGYHHRYLARDLSELGLVQILRARQLDLELSSEFQRKRAGERLIREGIAALREMVESAEEYLSPASIKALERVLEAKAKAKAETEVTKKLTYVDHLRKEGREYLAEAAAIYTDPCHPRGLVTVWLSEAMLKMDLKEYSAAMKKIRAAEELAAERDDIVAQTRVAIVEGWVLRKTGSPSSSSAKAGDAWHGAEKTESARLQAIAATLCGHCAKDDGNLQLAKRWRDRAMTLLEKDGSRDYAWDDLVELNCALMSHASIEKLAGELLKEAHLRQASLTAISEKFEEEIVASIFLRQNSSKSATAKWLATGDRKVREMVARRGLKGTE